jgi:chemotaxis protein MotB
MESSGVRANQVMQVRGFADRKLRKPKEPDDASNRRITLIIQTMPASNQIPTVVSTGKLPPTD